MNNTSLGREFISASRGPTIVGAMLWDGARLGPEGRSSLGLQTRARWWLGPVGSTLTAVTLAVALRLPFLSVPLAPDEGGYLLVASHWHDEGPFSYGRLFVDRPPLLLLVFRLADWWGGAVALRLIGCFLVATMVAAAAWAGWMIGGRRGVRWSAFTTAALMSTPLLGTHEIDGELLAAPWVMLSCALLLGAVRLNAPRRQIYSLALAAGMSGALAVLVKQNFVDGLVFAAVVLVTMRRSGGSSTARTISLLGAVAGGAVIPLGAAAVWAATSGSGLGGLGYAVYGFRSDALRVVLSQSLAAPIRRAQDLGVLAVLSGILLVAVAFALSRTWAGKEPVALGIGVMFATAAVSVALGGSYWSHYLLQLVPAAALGTARMSRGAPPSLKAPRVAVSIVLLSSLASSGTALASPQASSEDALTTTVAGWLSRAARPHDSLLITYGHATTYYESGLPPSYPFVWTLPMRTLDPGLALLRHQVTEPDGPVWLLEWSSLDSWSLAPPGSLPAVADAHYRQVQDVCGVRVFLRDGLQRSIPAAPACAAS